MTRDGLQGLLLVVALTQGLVPLALRAFGADGGPVWCLPQHLGAPGWWIAAAAAILVSAAAIVALDADA